MTAIPYRAAPESRLPALLAQVAPLGALLPERIA